MKKLFFIFLIITANLYSQENWDWGYQGINGDWCFSYIGAIDKQNNSYNIYPYSNTIIFSKDTLFSHSGYSEYQQNFALLKLDSRGNFKGAIDFITNYTGGIYGPYYTVVDDNLNLYLAFEIRGELQINDTILFNPTNGNDVILIKFNKDFDLIWAKYIYSIPQDKCHALLLTDDNNLFMQTEHYDNGSTTYTINYLDQDSIHFTTTTLSYLKIDLNGNLIWKKTAHNDNPGLWGISSTIGVDGNYYSTGVSFGPYYIDGDTILPEGDGHFKAYHFDIVFRPDGTIKRALLPESRVNIMSRIPDKDLNYFFTAILLDTTIFGTDTLYYNENTTAQLIGKMDTLYNPIWYEIAERHFNQASGFGFHIILKNDTLFFVTNANNDYEFADSNYILGEMNRLFFGKFTSDGELVETKITDSTDYIYCSGFKLDNCGNFLIGGMFNGELSIGNDTLFRANADIDDGFTIKYYENNESVIDLGNDTTITLSQFLDLSILSEYSNIKWSTGETSHKITINGQDLGEGSHHIWVEAFYGSCFVSSEIIVNVIDNSGIWEQKSNSFTILPNPFSTSTTIEYNLEQPETVRITFYNQFGKQVDLIEENQPEGQNKIVWKPKDLSDGIYYFRIATGRLVAGEFKESGKVIFLNQ